MNSGKPFPKSSGKTELEVGNELLVVPTKLGNITLPGIVDGGSQANMINKEYAKMSVRATLPLQLLVCLRTILA